MYDLVAQSYTMTMVIYLYANYASHMIDSQNIKCDASTGAVMDGGSEPSIIKMNMQFESTRFL